MKKKQLPHFDILCNTKNSSIVHATNDNDNESHILDALSLRDKEFPVCVFFLVLFVSSFFSDFFLNKRNVNWCPELKRNIHDIQKRHLERKCNRILVVIMVNAYPILK